MSINKEFLLADLSEQEIEELQAWFDTIFDDEFEPEPDDINFIDADIIYLDEQGA